MSGSQNGTPSRACRKTAQLRARASLLLAPWRFDAKKAVIAEAAPRPTMPFSAELLGCLARELKPEAPSPYTLTETLSH